MLQLMISHGCIIIVTVDHSYDLIGLRPILDFDVTDGWEHIKAVVRNSIAHFFLKKRSYFQYHFVGLRN